jgi:hypothetical protein
MRLNCGPWRIILGCALVSLLIIFQKDVSLLTNPEKIRGIIDSFLIVLGLRYGWED